MIRLDPEFRFGYSPFMTTDRGDLDVSNVVCDLCRDQNHRMEFRIRPATRNSPFVPDIPLVGRYVQWPYLICGSCGEVTKASPA